jgi:hypothetical protein
MGREHRPWWPPLGWGIGTQPGQDSSFLPSFSVLTHSERALKRGLHHLIRAEVLRIYDPE